MKNLFDGLLLYELTLLILGVLLFIILSIGLMYYIIKKEQIRKLLLFFIIPIVMIAYPSIKEISINNDWFKLVKYQELMMENPDDPVAREKVEEYTEKLEKRASNAKDMIQISKSKLLLGQYKEADKFASKALIKDNTNQTAMDIKKLVTVQENMEQQAIRQPLALQDTARLKKMIQNVEVTEDLKKMKPFLIKKSYQIK